jgi:putative tryptophan/tyrosine transport system substrate-binding protein
LVRRQRGPAAGVRETIGRAAVSDPISAGFVASLPHPGGNITGFGNLEGAMGEKWLQLLTEIVPGLNRAAIMFNPEQSAIVERYLIAVRD